MNAGERDQYIRTPNTQTPYNGQSSASKLRSPALRFFQLPRKIEGGWSLQGYTLEKEPHRSKSRDCDVPDLSDHDTGPEDHAGPRHPSESGPGTRGSDLPTMGFLSSSTPSLLSGLLVLYSRLCISPLRGTDVQV